jgi:hypothetical protein
MSLPILLIGANSSQPRAPSSDSLLLILGVAGLIGAIISVLVAVFPQVLEWYYLRVNRPLKVEVVRPISKISPAFGGLLRFRVSNLVRSAISVSVSPAHAVHWTGAAVEGILFDDPDVTIFPTNEKGWSFWLPGHDAREVEIHWPVRPGVLHGTEQLRPVVFANRFKTQQIVLGPFDVVVDPSFT